MLLHSNVFIALCSHHLCSMRGLLFRPQLLNIICLKDGSMNEAYLECTKSQVGSKNLYKKKVSRWPHLQPTTSVMVITLLLPSFKAFKTYKTCIFAFCLASLSIFTTFVVLLFLNKGLNSFALLLMEKMSLILCWLVRLQEISLSRLHTTTFMTRNSMTQAPSHL